LEEVDGRELLIEHSLAAVRRGWSIDFKPNASTVVTKYGAAWRRRSGWIISEGQVPWARSRPPPAEGRDEKVGHSISGRPNHAIARSAFVATHEAGQGRTHPAPILTFQDGSVETLRVNGQHP
jgi:hypothetical protein